MTDTSTTYRRKPGTALAMKIEPGADLAATRRVAEWMVDNGYTEDRPEDGEEVILHNGTALPFFDVGYIDMQVGGDDYFTAGENSWVVLDNGRWDLMEDDEFRAAYAAPPPDERELPGLTVDVRTIVADPTPTIDRVIETLQRMRRYLAPVGAQDKHSAATATVMPLTNVDGEDIGWVHWHNGIQTWRAPEPARKPSEVH